MEYYKICPTCETKNYAPDMLCTVCMADISGILPRSNAENSDKETDKTILEDSSLYLKFQNGMEKQIHNGDIIGRNLLGADILQEYKTISRKHARFTYENGKWFIEDLESSNGVFIDYLKIEPNSKIEIKNKQSLSISKSFEIAVIIR